MSTKVEAVKRILEKEDAKPTSPTEQPEFKAFIELLERYSKLSWQGKKSEKEEVALEIIDIFAGLDDGDESGGDEDVDDSITEVME